MIMNFIIFSVPLCCCILSISNALRQGDFQWDRHKFGFTRGPPFESKIDVIHDSPTAKEFFEKYAFHSKPVLMKGAAFNTPAFKLWQNDEYFLNLNLPDDERFTIETMKKENRTQEILDLNFRDFLQTYTKEERYMVHRVPGFLGQDVHIPKVIDCDDIVDGSIVEAIMWFSSGGTKSVVHTDSVDNLNCVYVGTKHFVMIDPQKYAKEVIFDHPEGAYSDIDVDDVDYDKYSGLLYVEYDHVDMEAGDCLFIPYKWIHQVRSYGGRNIAINIWWDTHRNEDIDLSRCNLPRDQPYTLNDVQYIGFDAVLSSLDAVVDHFLDFTRHQDMSLEQYTDMLLGDRDPELLGAGIGYTIPIKQLFKIIDNNLDGKLSHEEVQLVSDEDWEKVQDQLTRFDAIMEALDRRWHEQNEVDAAHDEL